MKTCERCGSQFGCGASQGSCWCMNVKIAATIPTVYKDCLCETCLGLFAKNSVLKSFGLVECKDFYYDKGLMVFTEKYHLDRGHCCNSGCRHCPYV